MKTLKFTHAGTRYEISMEKGTLGHVMRYGTNTFSLPHDSWRVIGFSTHHWGNRPTITLGMVLNDPTLLDDIKYVWDVDHGTTKEWGGSYHGKLPYVESATLEDNGEVVSYKRDKWNTPTLAVSKSRAKKSSSMSRMR